MLVTLLLIKTFPPVNKQHLRTDNNYHEGLHFNESFLFIKTLQNYEFYITY